MTADARARQLDTARRNLERAIRLGDHVAESVIRGRLCKGCAFREARIECLPTIGRAA